jgi:hypothetical protein
MRNPAPQFVKIWLSGPNHAPALRKTANYWGQRRPEHGGGRHRIGELSTRENVNETAGALDALRNRRTVTSADVLRGHETNEKSFGGIRRRRKPTD